jgi:cytochrome c-type biogenesis protein CcsB
MSGSFVLSIVTFIYGLAGFLYICAWIFRKQAIGRVATWIALIGLIGNTAGILMRWIESYQLGIGHAPFSNLYESLVFFAWVIVLIYLIIERRIGNRIIGAFTTPIACLVMAYASLKTGIPSAIQPLIPALKSNWLIAHVITCFVGYGAFAVAFGVSCMYLVKQGKPENEGSLSNYLPDVGVLDELTHQLIMFGFLFLSAGIITGAVWAHSAWGRYWGWDPKETWSLITWFVYATVLHARLMRGWRGKRIAYLSIVGFAAVLFTYFGVNLLPGLHSYGAG